MSDYRNLPSRMELPQLDEFERLGNRNHDDPDGAYEEMIEQAWEEE
jgi:hypothetical protein